MFRVSTALTFSALLVSSLPAAAADTARTVTFTKDVAPIFQAKCESCHRPDNMAPMSLMTYEEARPWAKSIAARVGARQMPPWHIDKTVGIQQFKNDRSLNDEQIDTISHGWPTERRKAIRRTCRPEGLDRRDGLEHGQQVRRSRSGREVARLHDAAGCAGHVVASGCQTDITEPRWVRAIEIRPVGKNARKITHHALARLQQPEDMVAALFTNDPTSPATACSWSGRWARTATNAARLRPLDAAELEDRVGDALSRGRRGDHGAHRARRVGLPKGQEPKHREVLALFNTFSGAAPGGRSLDIQPNAVTTPPRAS